jgi:hypothetical protein
VDDSPGYETILDKIADMTRELRMFSDCSEEAEIDDAPIPETRGPMLLLGSFTTATHSDILSSIPSKALVDHLVRKFFSSAEPAWSKSLNPDDESIELMFYILQVIFHIPTFLKEVWASLAKWFNRLI